MTQPLSMYQAFVPGVSNTLQALAQVLAKGAAHCEARKIDPAAFLQARLFPDMFPLVKQVQIACDMAKGGVARLAGIDNPKFDDTEASFAELQARIERTLAFMRSVSPEQIDGTEDKAIVTKRGDKETHYKGMQFLLGHAIPNVYFHSSMAYAILRTNGVVIGKRDYLGNP